MVSIILMALIAYSFTPGQKPTRTTHLDFPALPYDSVESYCGGVDLVVVGQAGDSTSRKFKLLGQDDARTVSAFVVEDIVRQSVLHPVMGGRIDVELLTGRHDLGASVRDYSSELQPLKKNHRYLLFLKWGLPLKAFYPVSGPSGIFEIDGEALRTTGPDALAAQIARRRLEDVLSSLKADPACHR